MRRFAAVVAIFVLCSGSVSGQGRTIRANYVTVTHWLQTMRGAPILNLGYYDQTYSSNIRDAFKVNYTGSGNYILNLQGDGASKLTLDKSGNLVLAGTLTAAGIFGSVSIPDTDGSHFLTLGWNENDTANRTLNFLVGGGNRSLTLRSSLVVSSGQDITFAAEDSPGSLTFDNATLEVEQTGATSRDLKLKINTDANAQLNLEGTLSAINQDLTTDAHPVFDYMALGTETPSSNVLIDIAETYTTTAGFGYGMRSYLTLNAASDSSLTPFAIWGNSAVASDVNYTDQVYGAYLQTMHSGSGTLLAGHGAYCNVNCSGAGDIDYAKGAVGRINLSGTGTITYARGLEGYVTIDNASANIDTEASAIRSRIRNLNGTMANAYGFYFTDGEGSSTITNLYGVYLEQPTKGDTNYGIYSVGGDNYFGGQIGLGTTSPDTQLELSKDAADAIATISAYHDDETTTPTLTLRKADNTEASPQPVDQNDILGTINFNGYDNDSFDNGARVYAKADANWGAAERGTELYLSTRDGAGALTDQFKVTAGGDFQGVTSKWWYCSYISMIEVSPGGSGATWTTPDANTIGGYQLNAANEYLYFSVRVCPNWDAASDLGLGIAFEVNVDNTGGGDADTVDLQLLCYYKGPGDTSSKTQTLEEALVVGKSPQYKVFNVLFIIDYDAVANVVAVYDVISFRVNLETDTSEVDDVILNHGAFRFRTKTGFIEISAAP